MSMCRCEAVWSGSRVCHCSACHYTFSSLGGFDQHRPPECRTPQELGLEVLRISGNVEVWGKRIAGEGWWESSR